MGSKSSITDLAISALFDLCVPLVSDGRLEQTFPASLVLQLTAKEKRDYAEAIGDGDGAWKVRSDHGIVLLALKQPYFRVITADHDPKEALAQFRSRLGAAGGTEKSAEVTADGFEQVHGMIDVGDDRFVSVIFSAQMSNPNAGFFGSACLVRKNGG